MLLFSLHIITNVFAESSYIHDITTSVSRDRHKFELKYLLTKEQMDKENWKPLVFKFEVSSSAGRALSDDAHVKVKKRTVKESYFGKAHCKKRLSEQNILIYEFTSKSFSISC